MDSIDTILGPLFTICQRTEPITTLKSPSLQFLPTEISGSYLLTKSPLLPIERSKSLEQLIQTFQESLDLELRVLLDNSRSKDELLSVYYLYQRMLYECYTSRENISDSSTIDTTRISNNLSVANYLKFPDFAFDDLFLGSSSNDSPYSLSQDLDFPYLCNDFAHEIFVSDNSIETPNDLTLNQQRQLQNSERSRKRNIISKESKDVLESVFRAKASPNSKERRIIADRCKLTPMQVRVWFTNKRARSKHINRS